MADRKRTGTSGAPVFFVDSVTRNSGSLVSCFSVCILLASLFAGCAAPSEPIERKPPTPQAVTDLAAEQSGNEILLTFTLPKEAVDDRPLKETPSIEIYRDVQPALKPGEAVSAPATPTLLAIIPTSMTTQYAEQGRVRYADTLAPSDFASYSDRVAVYIVRTRVSAKRSSANSNLAALHIFPVPEPVADLKAQVTHSGISLTWTPPERDLAGNRPAISGYQIYRAETSGIAPKASGEKEPEVRMMRIASLPSTATAYLDTQFDFGSTYSYSVRSEVDYSGKQLESADSNVAVILAKTTMPPAAPENLVAVAVPAQPGVPAYIDLSWQISPEPDLAGYNLYRSDQGGTPGTPQNTELLLTPAFRDMNVVPGAQYFYSVTAVDRSGNESPPSAAVPAEVPAENRPRP